MFLTNYSLNLELSESLPYQQVISAGNKIHNTTVLKHRKKLVDLFLRKQNDYGNRIIRKKTISYQEKNVLT